MDDPSQPSIPTTPPPSSSKDWTALSAHCPMRQSRPFLTPVVIQSKTLWLSQAAQSATFWNEDQRRSDGAGVWWPSCFWRSSRLLSCLFGVILGTTKPMDFSLNTRRMWDEPGWHRILLPQSISSPLSDDPTVAPALPDRLIGRTQIHHPKPKAAQAIGDYTDK